MPELPTGTVVFLMTDIEGSTSLVGRLGGAYPRLLDDHFAMLGAAVTKNGGTMVSSEGDSVFAVFPAARQAIEAAAEIQRGTATHAWPEEVEVRVRLGIHAGEAMLGGRDYTGIDVHRTARIMGSGSGGQVVVSDAARALAGEGMPGNVGFSDLGTHRLRGLTAPEHLHQLLAPGLGTDFPPLRSESAAARSNPPTPLTRFVGHTRELAAVRDLVEAHRLVTLTGPGGTGKTRLAIETARSLLDQFPDGVCFVALDVVTDPALVIPTIASTLAVPEQPGRPTASVLAEYLAQRRLLLVLDNLEQVIGAARDIAGLLQGAPALAILASSREPLAIAGEHVYAVPPLGVPPEPGVPRAADVAEMEAVVLFVERAQAVRAGFELTDTNAPAVAAICRRLDGLPLAIELAAARMNLLAPDQVLTRLDHRLALLASSRRDLPDRQRTLRGAIDWSHELLDEPERAFFRRFSVFAGGADLESVAEVVDPDGVLSADPLQLAAALVDRSLLRSIQDGDESRLAMLETIREYAAEQLGGSGEEEDVRERHAAHFRALAERGAGVLTDPRRDKLLDQLDRELANLRAATRWSIDSGQHETGLILVASLRDFWHTRNHLTEARGSLDELLRVSGPEATLSRERAFEAAAELASWQADYAVSVSLAEQALAMAEALGDRRGVAMAKTNIGWGNLRHRPEVARDLFEEATALAQEMSAGDILGGTLQGGALANLQLGDLDSARALAQEALDLAALAGETYISSFNMLTLGAIDLRTGHRDAALRRFREALRDSIHAGANIGAALALESVANLALDLGEVERAAQLASAGDRLRSESGGGPTMAMGGSEEPMDRVRAVMDPIDLERALAVGRALTLEQAAGLAFEVGEQPA